MPKFIGLIGDGVNLVGQINVQLPENFTIKSMARFQSYSK